MVLTVNNEFGAEEECLDLKGGVEGNSKLNGTPTGSGFWLISAGATSSGTCNSRCGGSPSCLGSSAPGSTACCGTYISGGSDFSC